jgi:hypothetical protein
MKAVPARLGSEPVCRERDFFRGSAGDAGKRLGEGAGRNRIEPGSGFGTAAPGARQCGSSRL